MKYKVPEEKKHHVLAKSLDRLHVRLLELKEAITQHYVAKTPTEPNKSTTKKENESK